MEKQRLMPDGGRNFCLPAGEARRTTGLCLSECGPDGVPWLMIAYAMPDNTSQLRLTNLTTGETSLLLTAGRCPDLPSEDEKASSEEDEEGTSEEEEDDRGGLPGSADNSVASLDGPEEASIAAADAEAEQSATPAGAAGAHGQHRVEASMEADLQHIEQDTGSRQPSAQPEPETQRLPGLGLDCEVYGCAFLADGKHIFLTGHPLHDMDLMCWQVLSIPDGETKALAWKRDIIVTPELIAGKYIIAQGLSRITVFSMRTLQTCCSIDLHEALRQANDADLKPGDLFTWRSIEATEEYIAVRVEGGSCWWALVFEMTTGRMHASYKAPPQHSIDSMEWIAPSSSSPVLAVMHHMPGIPARLGGPGRTHLTVAALKMNGQEPVILGRAQQDVKSSIRRMVWPAPGGKLVLGLVWEQGDGFGLRVLDLRTGCLIWHCALEDSEEEEYMSGGLDGSYDVSARHRVHGAVHRKWHWAMLHGPSIHNVTNCC